MPSQFAEIRKAFPIVQTRFPILGSGQEQLLVYLDHAASTHAPKQVIEKYTRFLESTYANIHRGNYSLSQMASRCFDEAVETLAAFVGADLSSHALITTSNTTEALNLASHLMSGIEGITLATRLEHHSNDL